jgi:hypothetical protein
MNPPHVSKFNRVCDVLREVQAAAAAAPAPDHSESTSSFLNALEHKVVESESKVVALTNENSELQVRLEAAELELNSQKVTNDLVKTLQTTSTALERSNAALLKDNETIRAMA